MRALFLNPQPVGQFCSWFEIKRPLSLSDVFKTPVETLALSFFIIKVKKPQGQRLPSLFYYSKTHFSKTPFSLWELFLMKVFNSRGTSVSAFLSKLSQGA